MRMCVPELSRKVDSLGRRHTGSSGTRVALDCSPRSSDHRGLQIRQMDPLLLASHGVREQLGQGRALDNSTAPLNAVLFLGDAHAPPGDQESGNLAIDQVSYRGIHSLGDLCVEPPKPGFAGRHDLGQSQLTGRHKP